MRASGNNCSTHSATASRKRIFAFVASVVAICAFSTGVVGQEANSFFEKGFDFLESGQTAEAIQSFEAGLKVDASSKLGWLYAGMAYQRGGDRAKAIAAYRRAVALDPEGDIGQKAITALAELVAQGKKDNTPNITSQSVQSKLDALGEQEAIISVEQFAAAEAQRFSCNMREDRFDYIEGTFRGLFLQHWKNRGADDRQLSMLSLAYTKKRDLLYDDVRLNRVTFPCGHEAIDRTNEFFRSSLSGVDPSIRGKLQPYSGSWRFRTETNQDYLKQDKCTISGREMRNCDYRECKAEVVDEANLYATLVDKETLEVEIRRYFKSKPKWEAHVTYYDPKWEQQSSKRCNSKEFGISQWRSFVLKGTMRYSKSFGGAAGTITVESCAGDCDEIPQGKVSFRWLQLVGSKLRSFTRRDDGQFENNYEFEKR